MSLKEKIFILMMFSMIGDAFSSSLEILNDSPFRVTIKASDLKELDLPNNGLFREYRVINDTVYLLYGQKGNLDSIDDQTEITADMVFAQNPVFSPTRSSIDYPQDLASFFDLPKNCKAFSYTFKVKPLFFLTVGKVYFNESYYKY